MSLTTTSAREARDKTLVLWLSTVAFTLLFSVWLMLGVLGIPIREELKISKEQMYWLGAAAILAGSILRFNFGVWADRFGGKTVFVALLLFTILPTYWVSRVQSYWELFACALLYGVAGNSFTAGIAWCAAWYPKEQQGLALGVFGAGNVGASGTKLIGPALIAIVPAAGLFGGLMPGGWRFVPVLYAVLLLLMAAAVWLFAPSPDRTPSKGRAFSEIVAPLRFSRAWQYGLHYVIVFGAYVALSLQLPTYYKEVYGSELASFFSLDLAKPSDKNTLLMWIGWLTALYIFPASLLRPLGGYWSDRFGPNIVMTGIFGVMIASGLILSIPIGLNVWCMAGLLFLLGCGMGIGKAAVYKLIPEHFPRDVGAVGGLVGLLGALGGFVLPLVWAELDRWTGIPQMTFVAVLILTLVGAIWFACDTILSRPVEAAPEVVEQVSLAPEAVGLK